MHEKFIRHVVLQLSACANGYQVTYPMNRGDPMNTSSVYVFDSLGKALSFLENNISPPLKGEVS